MAPRLQKTGKAKGTDDGAVSPETYLDARRSIGATKAALETAQSAHRNECKRFKNQGVNIKALLEVVALRKQEPDTVVAHFRDVFRYGRIDRAQFAENLDLFKPPADAVPTAKAQAEHAEFEQQEAGYIAGRQGHPADVCTFMPGTKGHVAFMKGWRKGQSEIARTMGGSGKGKVATAMPRAQRAKPGRKAATPPASAASDAPPLPLN